MSNTRAMTGNYMPEMDAMPMMAKFELPVDKDAQMRMEMAALVANMPAAFLERGVDAQGVESSPETDAFFNELNAKLAFLGDLDERQQAMVVDQALHTAEGKFIETNIGVDLHDLEEGETVIMPAFNIKRVGNKYQMTVNRGWVNDGGVWKNEPLIPNRFMAQTALPRRNPYPVGQQGDTTPGQKPKRKFGALAVISTAILVGGLILNAGRIKAAFAGSTAENDPQGSGTGANSSEQQPAVIPALPTNDDIIASVTNVPATPTTPATEVVTNVPVVSNPDVLPMSPDVEKFCADFSKKLVEVGVPTHMQGGPVDPNGDGLVYVAENNPELTTWINRAIELFAQGHPIDFSKCVGNKPIMFYSFDGFDLQGGVVTDPNMVKALSGQIVFGRSYPDRFFVNQAIPGAEFANKDKYGPRDVGSIVFSNSGPIDPMELHGAKDLNGDFFDEFPTDWQMGHIPKVVLPKRTHFVVVIPYGMTYSEAIKLFFENSFAPDAQEPELQFENPIPVYPENLEGN